MCFGLCNHVTTNPLNSPTMIGCVDIYWQIFALILSISGVVLFAYADGFGSHSTWGVVLAICSASALAVFKVRLFRYMYKNINK